MSRRPPGASAGKALPTEAKGTGKQPYVALLRGINVGGKNPLPMATLVEMFTDSRCSDVRTYIQSGNVVFRTTVAGAARIGEVISRRIAKRFGYELPIIVRSGPELDQILRANPFLGKPGVDEMALHVMFLAEQPTSRAVAALDPARSPPDRFAVVGREVYLHCPNGLGRSKLTNGYFDGRLGTHSTCRNWRTTLALNDLAHGPSSALTSSRAT